MYESFTICEKLGYEYNGHKRHLGDTPTDRRYLMRNPNTGKNDEMIVITQNPSFNDSSETTNKTTHQEEKSVRNDENSNNPDTSEKDKEFMDLFND